MKLLREGPYKTIRLGREEKLALVSNPVVNPCCEDEFDLDVDWYLTNDPNLDPEWDNRDSFWDRGEEYPYPYSLLIGGDTVEDHYESFSDTVIQRCGLGYLFGLEEV